MAEPGELSRSVLERVSIPAVPVVVALSGGADSAVLAWVAAQADTRVRAVFVDHLLPHSDDLKSAAQAIAAQLELELDIVEAPVDRSSPSFEDSARQARYRALSVAAGSDLILTGHTADDQAETVLSHLLRGAGARGLAGIPAEHEMLVRPLLTITREETRLLAAELSLPFFDDPDNQALDLRRNRIRSRLIPMLEAEFNPQLRAALSRVAILNRADDEILEVRAGEVPIRFDGECVRVPAALLQAAVLPEAISSRALRHALATIRGPHGGSHDEILGLLAVARGEARGLQLAGDLRAEREGPWLTIARPDLEPVAPIPVSVPFSADFDVWHLSVSEMEPEPIVPGSGTVVMDADLVGEALQLRPAVGPARIDVGVGTKAVADALGEAGVPRRLRARWPVLWRGDQVAGIPGVRTAAWARAMEATTRYLVVSMEQVAAS